MDDLLNCKCGCVVEIDYSSCTEFYGGNWQDVNVMCSNKCGYSVDITYNADGAGEGEAAKRLVIEAWNKQQEDLKAAHHKD